MSLPILLCKCAKIWRMGVDARKHRMDKAGRHIRRLSYLKPLFKAGSSKPSSYVPYLVEYWIWRLYGLFGQLVPMLSYFPSEKTLHYVKEEFPVFYFLPISSCHVTKYHSEKPGSILFTPMGTLLAHFHQSPSRSPGCSDKLPIRHF